LVFWFGEEPGYEAVQSRDDEGEQEDDDGGSDEGREKEESVPQDEWRRTRFDKSGKHNTMDGTHVFFSILASDASSTASTA